MRNMDVCLKCDKLQYNPENDSYVKCGFLTWQKIEVFKTLKTPEKCHCWLEQVVSQNGKHKYSNHICERCGVQNEDVNLESAGTAYVNKSDDPEQDQNRMMFLCPECAEEHHEYWKERWDEYYSSRL